jgi:hypothetical protein
MTGIKTQGKASSALTISVGISKEEHAALKKRLEKSGIKNISRLIFSISCSSETIIKGPGENIIVVKA